jgi:hypothetical protein
MEEELELEMEQDVPMPKIINVEYDALNNEPAIEDKPKTVDPKEKIKVEENYEQTNPSDQ